MPQTDVSETTSKYDVAVSSGAPSDESTATGTTITRREGANKGSLCVVIASLLFVGVFGGSLIGGLISGDPNNVYFIIIVVFATLAIGIAGTIVFQNVISPSFTDQTLEPVGKKEDLRKTFTAPSEDEHNDIEGEVYRKHTRTPGITGKEISAGSVVGEMSALSPYTYDDEGYSRRRGDDPTAQGGATPKRRRSFGDKKRKGPFDFASIASSRGGRRNPKSRGEDPPEDDVVVVPSDSRLFLTGSKDPSAPKVSERGNIFQDEEGPSVHTRASTLSRQVNIGYDASKTPTERAREAGDADTGKTADIHSLVRIRSIKTIAGTPREPSVHNRNDPDEEVEEVEVEDLKSVATSVPPPPPPPSAPQVQFRPPETKSFNTSGPASEVGSTVSSIFMKVFGKKKATSSEANYSEASSYIKGSEAGFSGYNNSAKQEPPSANSSERSEERYTPVSKDSEEEESVSKVATAAEKASSEVPPPQPNAGKPPRADRASALETISGSAATKKQGQNEDRYSNVGDTQSETAGSPYASSELKSTVGSSVFSGAASSTFDPNARNRALKMVQTNAFSLGAQPIVEQTASGLYEEASSTGGFNQPGTYDVFAPSGPIGLVVDTAKQGPVVHSLKKQSPMIGLINPGDLIIALDDQDVRKMNAASLTRLMAKKSKQPERKFTLMPIEEY